MDLLAHLDEPKYPDDVDASEIRNERKEMFGRLFDKYEERSKQSVISVDLNDSVEYYENYPHTEKELVENPRTKTFRKFMRNYGDLIDELTTVAGEPAEDEEELLLSASESEDDGEDFIDIINDCDSSQTSKGTIGVKDDFKAGDSFHNRDYDQSKFAAERKNTENETKPIDYSERVSDDADDADDENDLIYSAVKSKHSNSNLWIHSSSHFSDDKPDESEEKIHKLSVAFETFRSETNVEKAVSLDNSSNDEDDSASKEEWLENDGEESISDYLCRLTCTGCGREVATVLNIEDSARFKCDNCWLEYDHGCGGDGCRECREIQIWVQTRREVFRRISSGDLDGDATNQAKSDDPVDGGDGDKDDPEGGEFDDVDDSDGAGDDNIDDAEGGEDDDSSQCDKEELTCVKCGTNQAKSDDQEDGGDGDNDDPEGGGFDDVDDSDGGEDDDIDDAEGGEDDDSSQCDKEGLACVQCGAATEVPVVMEDSFSFHCDDCLLGYQHGCDINQDCQQCREIVIFVQARREVTIKLREGLEQDHGEKSKEAQMDDLEPLGDSLGSLSLEDVDEDMSMGSTAEESEADQNSQTGRSNLSDEIAVSTTGTITEDENKMDTTDVVSKDASCDLNDTVPVENKASKNKMTPTQLEILVPFFAENPRPTSDQKLQLALKTGLTKQVIQRWFDNRRRYTVLWDQHNFGNH